MDINWETSLSTKRNSESFDRGNHRSMMSLPLTSRSKINSHRSNFWSILARKRVEETQSEISFFKRIFTGPGDISLHSYLAGEEGTIPFRRGIYKGIYVYVYIYRERERRIAESIQLAKFHRTFIDITITAIYPAAGLFLRDTRRRVRGFGGWKGRLYATGGDEKTGVGREERLAASRRRCNNGWI